MKMRFMISIQNRLTFGAQSIRLEAPTDQRPLVLQALRAMNDPRHGCRWPVVVIDHARMDLPAMLQQLHQGYRTLHMRLKQQGIFAPPNVQPIAVPPLDLPQQSAYRFRGRKLARPTHELIFAHQQAAKQLHHHAKRHLHGLVLAYIPPAGLDPRAYQTLACHLQWELNETARLLVYDPCLTLEEFFMETLQLYLDDDDGVNAQTDLATTASDCVHDKTVGTKSSMGEPR